MNKTSLFSSMFVVKKSLGLLVDVFLSSSQFLEWLGLAALD